MHARGGEYYAFAFEPDKYNYQFLKRMIEKKYRGRVEIYNVGTWSEKMTLQFANGMDDSSRISPEGGTEIPVDSIDNIVGNRQVTFIKMDVEGAELNSLKGAYRCISNNRPRLAISIYHSDSDMIDIIEWLRKEFPFYRLYVRHYSWLFVDTVVYAVDPSNHFA